METPYHKVYEALRDMAKVRDKTDFGGKLGYSKTYASQLMNGHEPVTYGVILRLYTVFGVNPDFMAGASKEMFTDDIEPKESDLLKLLRENNKMLKAIMRKLNIE